MKIVIADDSKLLRTRFKELMKNFKNIEIAGEAENGNDALFLIQECKPDIAILDIRMPEMNGIEVLKKVRQEGLSIYIIILTNYPYKQYKERCLAEGADYFFDKNQNIESLIVTISGLAKENKSA